MKKVIIAYISIAVLLMSLSCFLLILNYEKNSPGKRWGQNVTSLHIARNEKRLGGPHTEQDSFGGSWFDDFKDDSGIDTGLEGVRLETDEYTVGLWHLDEGRSVLANDASGKENHGVFQNMEENDWVEGKFGKALIFDGVNEYVNCGNGQSLSGMNELTVEAWIQTAGIKSDQQRIISLWGGGG